jgi:hypothetical protein
MRTLATTDDINIPESSGHSKCILNIAFRIRDVGGAVLLYNLHSSRNLIMRIVYQINDGFAGRIKTTCFRPPSRLVWDDGISTIDNRNRKYESQLLTLIVPGKVKVDLANFDFNFLTKFLYISFFNDLFLQNRLPNLFELLTWPQKMMFWRPFWHFLSAVSHGATLPISLFHSVLLLIQTTWAGKKSRRAVVRSPVRHRSTLQLVSGTGLRRVQWGRQILSRACSLSNCTTGVASFWTNSGNRSILTHLANTRGGPLRPGVARSKTEWALVLDSPPGPRFN